MTRRHVIIGTGAAGLSAAQAIRAHDSLASVTLLTSDPDGYYSRPGLAYYLLNHVPADVLFPFTHKELLEQNLEIVTAVVRAVDLDQRTVALGNGTQLTYDRLLFASGSRSFGPDVPGADLDGVLMLDNMRDAHGIVARCRQTSSAVVVGGGTTAIEIAEGLRAQRVHVHYLMNGERYWPDVLTEAESRIIERRLASRGIQLHPYTRLARITGASGRVTGVETEDGTRIPCQIVGVSLGVTPNKEVAETAGLACARGVLVDDRMQTSNPDVYAAGDAAEVTPNGMTSGTLEILWNSAVGQGQVAGTNMATQSVLRHGDSVALNVTRLAGLKCMFIGTVGHGLGDDLKGLARGDSDVWRRLAVTTRVEFESQHSHIRLELAENRIAGAVVIGEQTPAYELQELVVSRADMSPIVDALVAQNASSAAALEAFCASRKMSDV